MKKILFFASIGSLIILFMMQVSCGTGRYSTTPPPETTPSSTAAVMEEPNERGLSDVEKSGEGTSTKIEDISNKVLLLGDRHKAAGIKCSDCHKKTPPANEVLTAVCITCHEDYAKIDSQNYTGGIDPHNSHMMFSDCGDCHHSHKPSQDQCQACHAFNFQTP